VNPVEFSSMALPTELPLDFAPSSMTTLLGLRLAPIQRMVRELPRDLRYLLLILLRMEPFQ